MNTDKKISRREALKRMGFAVMSSAIASSGLLSLASCETKRSKRIIFYFTGTGNSLYIARQLAGENAELLSIPQMVKRGKYEFEADEIGIVYPIYGHMPPYMVRQFIQKATNGQYSFDDINVDDNGKITGLPEKMCKIMNSQEANAKYEEIRDNIYMLTDYKNQYGLEDILAFKAGYNISDSEVSTVGTSGNNSVMDNAGYYKNMKTII